MGEMLSLITLFRVSTTSVLRLKCKVSKNYLALVAIVGAVPPNKLLIPANYNAYVKSLNVAVETLNPLCLNSL